MTRAFTREIDDAPPPPPPELPISAHPNLVTRRGARLIEAIVADLEKEIAAASDPDIVSARSRVLRYWNARHASMQIVDADPEPTAVGFGVTVTIRRRQKVLEIKIVGEDEADPSAGLIAWTAPLARILEDTEPGDTVELDAGGRTEPITLISMRTERAEMQ